MRVAFRWNFLPTAVIKIERSEHEPSYCVGYEYAPETVALMPNEPLPDREVEISVGLPTILSLAGAILGKDRINESPAV